MSEYVHRLIWPRKQSSGNFDIQNWHDNIGIYECTFVGRDPWWQYNYAVV